MAILAFGKLSFDFGPLPARMPWAPRSSLTADDAGGYPHRSQVGVVRFAIISFIARGFPGAAVDQGGQLLAVVHIAGGGLDPHNKLRIGVLHFMGLIAIKGLFLAFAAKTGVRVRGVPVDIMVVIVAAPLPLVLLFQAKQVDPGGDMGGVDDVEAVSNKAPTPGLFHQLVEQSLKALRPQPGPEAAQGREIGRQLLGAQPQEPLVGQVKSGLFLHLAIRQIIEKLQKHHFEHQHRVPRFSPPINIKVFAVLRDKAKIHHLRQVFQEVGSLGQNLLIKKIAKEGAVGFALFSHGRP